MEDEFRPQEWDEYIGQEAVKETLRIHIEGARERGHPLDHILLMGPPGCGKTSLAALIANDYDAPYDSYICPIKEKLLIQVAMIHDGVLLLDEIHRFSKSQQEALLPLIEDGYYQTPNGGRVDAEWLTIIGATTEPEKLIDPLIDRFQIKPMFHEYSDEEMGRIVQGMAARIDIDIDAETAVRLGRATGGTPRNAKALVNMARDLHSTDADLILAKCRLTEDGLGEQHIRYITTLQTMGGKAGLDVLSAHMRLPKGSLVDLERLLLKRMLVEYTGGGRELLPLAYKQFNPRQKTRGN